VCSRSTEGELASCPYEYCRFLTYHKGVNKGVNENKLPDGSRHVTHASPHAEHGSSVVVGLESRTELALGENDESVENLVELAEIEDPTIESQTLVPHTTADSSTGKAINNGGVLSSRNERTRCLVVVH
jgi:hypothetical protein